MESLVAQQLKRELKFRQEENAQTGRDISFTPTVMKNVSPCMRIASEFFGPIAAVVMKIYRYYNQYTINRQSYFSRNLSCY